MIREKHAKFRSMSDFTEDSFYPFFSDFTLSSVKKNYMVIPASGSNSENSSKKLEF